jgi:hypothetical protein
MRLEAAVWGCLLTSTAWCSHGLDFAHRHLHLRAPVDHAHNHLKRSASRTVDHLVRRADVFNAPGGIWPTVAVPPGFTLAAGVEITPIPGMTVAIQSVTGTITGAGPEATALPVADPAKWNAAAEAACMAAVNKLNGKADNPAGIAVCYNVPYLDEKRGIFEAELRMYNVSAPTAPFIGVTPDMMMVTLQYAGATIQKSDGTLPVKKRSLDERQLPAGTMPVTPTTNGISAPVEIAVKKYVGQINTVLMSPQMNLYVGHIFWYAFISGTNPSQNAIPTSPRSANHHRRQNRQHATDSQRNHLDVAS